MMKVRTNFNGLRVLHHIALEHREPNLLTVHGGVRFLVKKG